jgi:hypothetical protein
MSGMDDFVDVLVTRDGKKIAAGRYKLPVTFGRMAQSSVRLGHSPPDDPDKTISRVHAQIEAGNGRLQLTDCSSNGTLYKGRLMKNGETVPLADDDSFNVRDYLIKVTRAKHDPNARTTLEAHFFVRDLPSDSPIAIGEMMVFCVKTAKGIRFDQAPATSDLNIQDIAVRYRLQGDEFFAAIYSIRDVAYLEVEHEAPVAITRNKGPVTSEQVILKPHDVIQFGDVRIDLHAPGEKSLICTNAACRLLNPYNNTVNCRFCGFHLAGAHTRYALVKPGGRRKTP